MWYFVDADRLTQKPPTLAMRDTCSRSTVASSIASSMGSKGVLW